MEIFTSVILPVCNTFPGDRSVVIADNAPTHIKPLIRSECARKGVIPLFLPPYGYVLNPTELVINAGRTQMQRSYGLGNQQQNMNGRSVGEVFVKQIPP